MKDVSNPLKFILGEPGTGKSHVCMALAKKYTEELMYDKIFYLIPRDKEAFKQFVQKSFREQFEIDLELENPPVTRKF